MNAATCTVRAERLRPAVRPTEIVAPVRMHPKEHGAYAILGIPLVAALFVGNINAVVVLILSAAITGFMAHEPLMIALGRRGRRALLAAPHASSRMSLLIVIFLCSGGMAFWWASADVRLALMACLLLAGIGFLLSAAGLQRTLPVQVLDMASLTLPSSAMLLAGGIDQHLIIRLTAAWMMGRIATTTAVRSAIAKLKTSHQGKIAAGTVAILSGFGAFIMIIPMLAAAIWIRFLPTRLIQLRRIGWILLGVNVMSAILMIVFLTLES